MRLLGDKPGFICFDDTHVKDVLIAMTEFQNEEKDRISDTIVLDYSTTVFKIKAL